MLANPACRRLPDHFGMIRSTSAAAAGQARRGSSSRARCFRPSLWQLVFLSLVSYAGLVLSAVGAESHLGDRLRPLIAAHKGNVAVAVKHLETGEEFAHNADRVMPTASLIKVAVMATAYRLVDAGKLDLRPHGDVAGGRQSARLRHPDRPFLGGGALSVRDAIRLMIAFSDNTATNLVLDQIGLRTTAETMDQLGFPNTKIHAKVYRRERRCFPSGARSSAWGARRRGR